MEYTEDTEKLQANKMLEMERSMVAAAIERAQALRPATDVGGASSPTFFLSWPSLYGGVATMKGWQRQMELVEDEVE